MVPKRTPVKVEVVIERLRWARMTRIAIAAKLGMAVSTVVAVLARPGLNRLSRLEPVEPASRYARRHAGELIHVDSRPWAGSPVPASAHSARAQAASRPGRAGRRCRAWRRRIRSRR